MSQSMSTRPTGAAEPETPPTPFATVIGWLAVAFSLLPLLMGIHDDARVYFPVGGVLLAAGIVSILIGRFKR